MNEALRHEIVQRHQAGASARAIARELGVTRRTVGRVLAHVAATRQDAPSTLPPPSQQRVSLLDDYEPVLKELLERYPNMTAQRVFEELRSRGFTGKYTIVRQRVRHLRARPTHAPVIRFETGPGMQAQMDYGTYDIDFVRDGRRRVYLFSYVLSYSRRQYLRFVEAMDLHTTLREHIRAFTHLGGVPATCLYDNFKVVVLRHDADGPLYNPKFLAFATHYGFRPWACQPRRPQTKGKVERRFQFAETSLLNGRTFDTLDHLNEVTAWWLDNDNVADVHPLRDVTAKKRRVNATSANSRNCCHCLLRLTTPLCWRTVMSRPTALSPIGKTSTRCRGATSARSRRSASPNTRSSFTRPPWK